MLVYMLLLFYCQAIRVDCGNVVFVVIGTCQKCIGKMAPPAASQSASQPS